MINSVNIALDIYIYHIEVYNLQDRSRFSDDRLDERSTSF